MSGMATSQIASSVFAVGTTAVLPFYTLMVVAPKAEIVSLFYVAALDHFQWLTLFFLLKLSWVLLENFYSKLHFKVKSRVLLEMLLQLLVHNYKRLIWNWIYVCSLLCRPRSVWRVAYRMSSSAYYTRICYTFLGHLIRSNTCFPVNTCYQRFVFNTNSITMFHCTY